MLREAAEAGRAVEIAGLGTKRSRRAERPGALELSSLGLDRIVDYRPEDLTLTAEPGIPLARLDAVLAERGQALPFDPPEGGTLGGTVAAAAIGPRRLAHGAPRDSVLGLTVALASGEVVRTGSRMVKNVAGYDLTKLLVGSLGSLGFVAGITIKVRPRPRTTAGLVHTFASVARAIAFVRRIREVDLFPAALVLTGPTLETAFEGSEAAVRYQVERTEALSLELGASPAGRPARPSDACRLRANLPTDRALDFAAGLDVPWFAYAGSGVVYLLVPADGGTIRRLRIAAEAHGGRLVVEDAPPGAEPAIDRWGARDPGHEIARRIKETFDPRGVLAPGPFAS